MIWGDERYVRIYTRDTATWKKLKWQAKFLLPVLLRKLDRSGAADLGDDVIEGIAALTDAPADFIEQAWEGRGGLQSAGVFTVEPGGRLFAPNFRAAQESKASDAERKRRQREREKLFEPEPQEVVYFVRSVAGGPIKIGRAKCVQDRLVTMNTGRPDQLHILATTPGGIDLERVLHARFATSRVRGEWYEATEELLDFIKSVTECDSSHASVTVVTNGHAPSREVTPSLAVPSSSSSHAGGGLPAAAHPPPAPSPTLTQNQAHAHASVPGPARELPGEGDLSASPKAVLAELRKHPDLAHLVSVETAHFAARKCDGGPKSLAQVLQNIQQAADEALMARVGGDPMQRHKVSSLLRHYLDAPPKALPPPSSGRYPVAKPQNVTPINLACRRIVRAERPIPAEQSAAAEHPAKEPVAR